MVSKYGKEFLRVLATYEHPVDYWDIQCEISIQKPELEIPSGFETYLKRYLIDKGYVERFTAADTQRSWVVITKKGLLIGDPKRAKAQIRARISAAARQIMEIETNKYYAGNKKPLIKKAERQIEKLCKIFPDGRISADHAFTTEYASTYVRFWDDPHDKDLVDKLFEVLCRHVDKDFIKKYLLGKIIRRIKYEIRERLHSQGWFRLEPQLPTEMIITAAFFNIDPTDSIVKGYRLFEKEKQRGEESRRQHEQRVQELELEFTMKNPEYAEVPQEIRRCVVCGNQIHSREVVLQAHHLYQETGIKSGAVCCRCFDRLRNQEQQVDEQ